MNALLTRNTVPTLFMAPNEKPFKNWDHLPLDLKNRPQNKADSNKKMFKARILQLAGEHATTRFF